MKIFEFFVGSKNDLRWVNNLGETGGPRRGCARVAHGMRSGCTRVTRGFPQILDGFHTVSIHLRLNGNCSFVSWRGTPGGWTPQGFDRRVSDPSSIYINGIRCVSVCVSVCCLTPPGKMDKYRHMIYGSNRNLSGTVLVKISSRTDQRFKSYERKRGADWKAEKIENGKYSGLAGGANLTKCYKSFYGKNERKSLFFMKIFEFFVGSKNDLRWVNNLGETDVPRRGCARVAHGMRSGCTRVTHGFPQILDGFHTVSIHLRLNGNCSFVSRRLSLYSAGVVTTVDTWRVNPVGVKSTGEALVLYILME